MVRPPAGTPLPGQPALRVRAELIGHFKACMTDIYLHIDARMADYIRTHPYLLPKVIGHRGACMHRQIDTGPVLVPDLSRRFTPTIAAFSLGTWSSNSHRAFLEPAASTQRVLLCAGRIHRDDLDAPSRGRLHPRAADGAAAARRGDGAALQRAALAAGAELAVGRGVTVGRIEAQRAHLILCPPRRQPLGHPQLHQYRGVLRCMSRHLASNHV